MIKVGLHGAEFFARHGLYPEEQILGNRFIIDIEVEFEPAGDLNADQLANTVNYEQLYNLTAAQMQQTKKLIETVAQGIMDAIKQTWPNVNRISVSVKKLNPPLKGRVAFSSITIIQ